MKKLYSYRPAAASDNGYSIVLNDKNLKTPQGNPLIAPTAKLAEAMVAEWQRQGEKINKHLLKLTPIACVAIDLAQDRREAMLADVVPYIDTDLVCYRAGEVLALVKQQQDVLDPLLLWVKERFGIVLQVTGGVMPLAQDAGNQPKFTAVLEAYDNWKLAAFAVAVKPLGSAVLALALLEGRLSAADAFRLAHLEEAYETQKWGVDDEKEKHLNAKKEDLQAVERFLSLLAK